MSEVNTFTGRIAKSFADIINVVDKSIGENRDYDAGIGPHDEDDQVDAPVEELRKRGDLLGDVLTAKSESTAVRYPGGNRASGGGRD